MEEQFTSTLQTLQETLLEWYTSLISSIPNVVVALIVLMIGLFLARYVRKGSQRALKGMTKNKALTNLGTSLSTAIFFGVVLFIILGILNLDTVLTTALAGAGVLGLAVGLALQDPMINLFSGVMMSTKSFYKIGDLVETNGFFGTIQRISLRNTVIVRPDGQDVIIPNKDIVQAPLVNFTHNPKRRIDVPCGVAYGDDLVAAKAAIQKEIQAVFGPQEDKPAEVFFTDYGDSSINFMVRVWQELYSQRDYMVAQDKIVIAIKKAIDDNGFTIPFPIRTLDFGVVGGERLDELYPLEKLTNGRH